MKKLLSIISVFLLLYLKAEAVELPTLKLPVNETIVSSMFADSSFGEGIFQAGIIFNGEEFVKAAQHGKKLIVIENKQSLKNFPSALGNAVIIAHEAGLQTVYGGLDSGALISETDIESGAVIGRSSPDSEGKPVPLIFQVIDSKEKIFIHPMKLLPFQVLEDKIAPVIKNTFLVDENGKIFNLEKVKNIRQGSYSLFSSISDGINNSAGNFSPLEIVIFVNGITSGRLPFYELEGSKGQVYLRNTKYSAAELYSRKGHIYLGKISLTRGSIELILNAADFSQNETKVSYTFKVE